MPLSHFTNIQSHFEKWEPVYKNLFEVTILLPTALQQIHPDSKILLMENATSASLPTYPPLATATQKFKYSTRLFLTTPDTTSISETSIKFNLNVNNQLQVFAFRMLKDWFDLGWNNETGELNYKRNLVGDIIINVHDREGMVIRRVTFHNAMMTKFTGWEDLSWDSGTELASLDAGFAVDYWEDQYY